MKFYFNSLILVSCYIFRTCSRTIAVQSAEHFCIWIQHKSIDLTSGQIKRMMRNNHAVKPHWKRDQKQIPWKGQHFKNFINCLFQVKNPNSLILQNLIKPYYLRCIVILSGKKVHICKNHRKKWAQSLPFLLQTCLSCASVMLRMVSLCEIVIFIDYNYILL